VLELSLSFSESSSNHIASELAKFWKPGPNCNFCITWDFFKPRISYPKMANMMSRSSQFDSTRILKHPLGGDYHAGLDELDFSPLESRHIRLTFQCKRLLLWLVQIFVSSIRNQCYVASRVKEPSLQLWIQPFDDDIWRCFANSISSIHSTSNESRCRYYPKREEPCKNRDKGQSMSSIGGREVDP
jgi:hypothetical protein